jgi:hypothetical protein
MSFALTRLFGALFFLFIILPIAIWLIKLPFEIGEAVADRFEGPIGIAVGIFVALAEVAAVVVIGGLIIASISFAPR